MKGGSVHRRPSVCMCCICCDSTSCRVVFIFVYFSLLQTRCLLLGAGFWLQMVKSSSQCLRASASGFFTTQAAYGAQNLLWLPCPSVVRFPSFSLQSPNDLQSSAAKRSIISFKREATQARQWKQWSRNVRGAGRPSM